MKDRRLLALGLLTLLTLGGITACNRDSSVQAAMEGRAPALPASEQDFMTKVAQANLAEIGMARLAVIKSANADVKAFANMIHADHSSALDDLTTLMTVKNISNAGSIPDQTQQDITRMNQLSGSEFDREFINTMVADHQRTVEMFRDESLTAEDPDVKKYAVDVLPTLEMHLEKAQRIQSSLFR